MRPVSVENTTIADLQGKDLRIKRSWQTKEASPQWGVPKASALSLLARNEPGRRSKVFWRRLSERDFESRRAHH